MTSISGRLTPSTTTVNTTATIIPSTAASGRRSIEVYNNGSNTVFLGNSSVTTSTGMPLVAGGNKAYDLDDSVVLYGITASGSSDVRSLEGS
jgi:hypothetical protein